MFGTTALEQFMERVIEWPQYCNHILQISHLRGTHAELISAIEQALAKISLSQNEPNLSPMLPVDQRVSGSQSIENIEVHSHPLGQEGNIQLVVTTEACLYMFFFATFLRRLFMHIITYSFFLKQMLRVCSLLKHHGSS
jgi:hypothetical protein